MTCMDWLKKQHHALWQFYRETFGEALLMTTAAFLIICLLGFGVSLFNKSIPEFVVNYFTQMVRDGNIVTDDGTIHFGALLVNNLRAAAISVLYGFIPFLYLTALAVGMNALILGVLAAYYVNSGTSLLIYFAGILPHGVFELSALLIAFALGLLLCRRITQYVRKNTKGMMKPLLCNIARSFVMHVLPLLVMAAVVETYITPAVLALFM